MRRVPAFVAMLLLCAGAFAQQPYPSRPIRFIVPYAPGGGTDIVARLLAQRLGENLGQPVVVENHAGSSGVIGTEMASKAAPDGYTLLLGTTGPFAVNPNLYPKLYDPGKDFAPVSLVSSAAQLLAVNPSLPIKSVKELIAYAKANPGKLAFSSAGGSSRLSGEMLNVLADIQMLHVPYRGVGSAATAIVSGEVSLGFSDIVVLLPHVKSGKLRALATTGAKRSAAVPDLPTVAEEGVPGFESAVWYGVLVPAATPKEIVARLHGAVVKAVQTPEFRDRLLREGSDVVGNTPEEFAAYIARDRERWAQIVKAGNIKVE
ncbi:tripartite tricarboxylate transporter substrate binding protein [Pigmentiphaga soli]|uniref:Tripartite tricarboxylate transporter substrate binding protein n=1 Tax=Pigmentiphaga soli TaxID=1007095 RepID=A0ABP8HRX8_9BURK